MFIFKFSKIKSALNVLFAKIPPTFAAAFTTKSGLCFDKNSWTSTALNRFKVSRFEAKTSSKNGLLSNFRFMARPTKP